MKVIFLDVDGVLNNQQTFRNCKKEYYKTGYFGLEIDLKKIRLLKEIVLKTDARIVLSSTWRSWLTKVDGKLLSINHKMKDLLKLLEVYGLYIYDITPYDDKRFRQNEIMEWLKNHQDIESFVVIDDDSYDLEMFVNKELVKTKFHDIRIPLFWIDRGGLQKEHVEKAIEILNKNDKKKVLR